MSEVTPDCLDPETLAAWMDDGLSAGALESARAHVAGCARCQALVATMVRIEPAAAPQPARVSRWWIGWLVPAAAAAAALVLWLVVPRDIVNAPLEELASKEAARPTAAAPPPPPPAAAAPATPPPARERFADERDALSRRADAKADAKKELKDQARNTSDLAAAATAKQVESRALDALGSVRQESQQKAAAPAPPSGAVPLDIRSPDPAVRWRVTGARVEFTSDNGVTWTAQPVALTSTITAGSAPSRDVCWLVGRGGAVWLATNAGGTWQRLAFPEAVDLTAVRAVDGRSATIAAADGHEFTTSDAGQTWVRRLVQGFRAGSF